MNAATMNRVPGIRAAGVPVTMQPGGPRVYRGSSRAGDDPQVRRRATRGAPMKPFYAALLISLGTADCAAGQSVATHLARSAYGASRASTMETFPARRSCSARVSARAV
jgi:hypothetical protein